MKLFHKITAIFLAVSMLALLCGCNSFDREYLEDISVPLEGRSGEIVIKEWRFLLGSGTEIYYRENGSETLLGKTSGGDDGYCPFSEGKYKLSVENNTLVIEWYKNTDPTNKDVWGKASFELPG